MNILYAEDEEAIQEICIMSLEAELDCNIKAVQNGEEAISYLKDFHSEIDIIISDYNMPVKNGGEIYKYLISNNFNIPFILTSSDRPQDHEEFKTFKKDNKLNTNFVKPFSLEDLSQYILSLGIESNKTDNCNFIRVRSNVFRIINQSAVDVYLKLTETKMVKIINAGDIISNEDIEKYIQKDINHFYINSCEYETLFKEFSNTLSVEIEKSITNLNFKNKNQAISLFQASIQSFGITEELRGLADAVIDSCIKDLDSVKNLKKIFEEIIVTDDLRYSYVQFVIYISASLIKKMQLKVSGAIEKVAMAGLLMDISLEDDYLFKIRDLSKENDLTSIELDLVKKHTLNSEKLFSKNSKVPYEVGELVLNHHERPDGKGFPRGLNANNTSQLSAVFNLACEISHLILVKEYECKDAIELLRDAYNFGSYEKPFNALEKLLDV